MLSTVKYLYRKFATFHIFTTRCGAVQDHAASIFTSSLKMEAAWSYKTLVTYRITIWRHNPEGCDLNSKDFKGI